MNIFVVHEDPYLAACALPDKLVVKMPVETAQMLAVIYSPHMHDIGPLFKADGTPYNTKKGAWKNHPCTQWAAKNRHNINWLLQHGIGLCDEFRYRYGKDHGSEPAIRLAGMMWSGTCWEKHSPFVRCMPDEFKNDTSISTVEAYRRYLLSKPWVKDNYHRTDRKPSFITHEPDEFDYTIDIFKQDSNAISTSTSDNRTDLGLLDGILRN
tara:strand:- start:5621 stop:6250 length:630 start_codon:yes stop_codon:yes gene_type:complete